MQDHWPVLQTLIPTQACMSLCKSSETDQPRSSKGKEKEF